MPNDEEAPPAFPRYGKKHWFSPVPPTSGQAWVWDTDRKRWVPSTPSGTGAPTDADYLVGTTNATLTAEIVVGTTPGGELGGTWASPTVDATHSGSAHHAAVTIGADADVLLGLSGQALSLDAQAANVALAGPVSGVAADPTFRALVPADLPSHSLPSAHGDGGLGYIVHGDFVTGAWANLNGNSTTTRKFLRQTGNGVDPTSMTWDTVVDGDVPATHSGSAHHAAVTIGADAEHSLATQVLSGVDAAAAQKGHLQLAGELGGSAAAPTVNAAHGGTHAIAQGGTGQTTAQAAIDALTAVAGATNEHVLTKDTATGNAIFKAAAGGGGGGAAGPMGPPGPEGEAEEPWPLAISTHTHQPQYISAALSDDAVGANKVIKFHEGPVITVGHIAINTWTVMTNGVNNVFTFRKGGVAFSATLTLNNTSRATAAVTAVTFAAGDMWTVDHTSGDTSGGFIEAFLLP